MKQSHQGKKRGFLQTLLALQTGRIEFSMSKKTRLMKDTIEEKFKTRAKKTSDSGMRIKIEVNAEGSDENCYGYCLSKSRFGIEADVKSELNVILLLAYSPLSCFATYYWVQDDSHTPPISAIATAIGDKTNDAKS